MKPTYTLRESSRAKYPRLKMSVHRGLEVIVPQGFDQTLVPQLLQKKQPWITRATQQIEAQKRIYDPAMLLPLPDQVNLPALGKHWQIDYQLTSANAVSIQTSQTQILVQGPVENSLNCKRALHQWIRCRAQEQLTPWLRKLSEKTNLPFGKLVVRRQKTRWASCSGHKTISLNSQLLFLPADLVEYVFRHELCHTIHMNHSAAFWALLQQQAPDYKSSAQSLRQAWCYVPLWMIDR